MRRVIVESPFAGKPTVRGFGTDLARELTKRAETTANILYARAAVRDAVLRGEAPIASHLLLTQPGILNDDVPHERELGIEAGLAWRGVADASVVYTDRGVSGGMQYGMDRAAETGLTVERRSLPGDWSTTALVPWDELLRLVPEAEAALGSEHATRDREEELMSALLHARGWGLFQTGPDEGDWLKFHGKTVVARAGDSAWQQDYEEARDAARRLAA